MENDATPAGPAAPAPLPDHSPDRSKIQNVYPAPTSAHPLAADPPATTEKYEAAAADFADASVIIAGGLSATLFLVIDYFAKNEKVAGGISILLALVAMVLAVRNYRAGRGMSPLGVIGLSAATFTPLYAANMLIARAMIHSLLY